MRRIDLGPIAENAIDDIATNLYKRIQEETNKILVEQLNLLNVDCTSNIDELCERRDYPDNDLLLCSYWYKDVMVLLVRVAENKMSVVFEVPNFTSQNTLNRQCDETVQQMVKDGVDPQTITKRSYWQEP